MLTGYKKLGSLSLLSGTTRNNLLEKDTTLLDTNLPGARFAKKWNGPLNFPGLRRTSDMELFITTNSQGTQMSQSCRFGICCSAVIPVVSRDICVQCTQHFEVTELGLQLSSLHILFNIGNCRKMFNKCHFRSMASFIRSTKNGYPPSKKPPNNVRVKSPK